ncbi:MAG: helix-turn-helix domain-containing protein [Geobacter sp.]
MKSKKSFADKLKETGLKQKEIAKEMDISVATVSLLMSEKQQPTKQHLRLFDLAFKNRKPYINPTIEAVAQIMEQLPPEAQAEVLKAAEKEKVFVEAGKGR